MASVAGHGDGDEVKPRKTTRCNVDVFLSHKGSAIKKNFVHYLHDYFNRVGVISFVDELSLQPGESNIAWDVITANVRSARIKMAVLSRGFGEYCYCLEELRIMIEMAGNIFMPVFFCYDFDNLEATIHGSINSAYQRGEELYVQHERAYHEAVEKAFAATGRRLDQFGNNPVELAKQVVQDVLATLSDSILEVPKYTVDINERVSRLLPKLVDVGARNEVVVLVLHGMGGVGKTTLANTLYNQLHRKFAGSSCYVEVGQAAKGEKLVELQLSMLKQLSGSEISKRTQTIVEGKAMLRTRLQRRRVLLYVDDVWSENQIEALLGPLKLDDVSPVLSSGSCVLVTTRDRMLLHGHKRHTLVEEVPLLDAQPARRLFCLHAFHTEAVPASMLERKLIMEDISKACDGLPLALEVVGSYLYTRGGDGVEVWREALKRMRAAVPVHGTQADPLWNTLRLSFDVLNHRLQQMFLDICCFALGKEKELVLPAWGQGAAFMLARLVDLSLVRISSTSQENVLSASRAGCIEVFSMHNQLRDMGRRIARSEVPHRIWRATALSELTRQDYKAIKTVLLDVNAASETVRAIAFMPHLRMLSVGTSEWDGKFDASRGVPHGLTYLEWRVARSSTLSAFLGALTACTELAVLVVNTTSQAEEEDENPVVKLPESLGKLIALQVLDLHMCHVTELPSSVGALAVLQMLHLSRNKLTALPKEIGQLANLQLLNLESNQLTALPAEIGQLRSLRELHLSDNKLTKLPKAIGQLASLQVLVLTRNQLTALPSNIGQLARLHTLYLDGNELLALPLKIGQLASLQQLDLADNQLTALPREVAQLTCLQWLNLARNQLTALVPEIGQLASLQKLNLANNQLMALTSEMGNLVSLLNLNLSSNQLKALPPEIGRLANLCELNLYSNQLTALPPGMGRLVRLQELNVARNKLTALPPDLEQLANLQIDLAANPIMVPLAEGLKRPAPAAENYSPESGGDCVELVQPDCIVDGHAELLKAVDNQLWLEALLLLRQGQDPHKQDNPGRTAADVLDDTVQRFLLPGRCSTMLPDGLLSCWLLVHPHQVVAVDTEGLDDDEMDSIRDQLMWEGCIPLDNPEHGKYVLFLTDTLISQLQGGQSNADTTPQGQVSALNNHDASSSGATTSAGMHRASIRSKHVGSTGKKGFLDPHRKDEGGKDFDGQEGAANRVPDSAPTTVCTLHKLNHDQAASVSGASVKFSLRDHGIHKYQFDVQPAASRDSGQLEPSVPLDISIELSVCFKPNEMALNLYVLQARLRHEFEPKPKDREELLCCLTACKMGISFIESNGADNVDLCVEVVPPIGTENNKLVLRHMPARHPVNYRIKHPSKFTRFGATLGLSPAGPTIGADLERPSQDRFLDGVLEGQLLPVTAMAFHGDLDAIAEYRVEWTRDIRNTLLCIDGLGSGDNLSQPPNTIVAHSNYKQQQTLSFVADASRPVTPQHAISIALAVHAEGRVVTLKKSWLEQLTTGKTIQALTTSRQDLFYDFTVHASVGNKLPPKHTCHKHGN